MKICRVIFLLFLLCLARTATGVVSEDLIKLDPILKPLVLKQDVGGALRAPMLYQREPGLINTIIKVSDNPMAIRSAGAQVRSVVGNILTADIPIHSLSNIIKLPNVVYVQASRKVQVTREMKPALDISVPDTKADQVWQSTPGYTGEDTIIGVIDSGIDWKHPDFMGEDGKPRILYIWDQTVHTPGQYPIGYRYGTEWTKAQIDAGQCREMDADSHGTHVTSTIAGNGQNRHEFTGMAPDADIIFVKTTYDDADIIDAAVYIFHKANELNKPVVINLSLGSQWGPHDGTELQDQAMDELLDRPGRVIVAAAGNDGGFPLHAGTSSLRRPFGEDYPWVAVQPLVGAPIIPVEIWYDPAETISVRLLLPKNDNGDLADLGSGWVAKGELRIFFIQEGPLAGTEVVIDAQLLASDLLYPNFNRIYIQIYDNDDPNIPIDEYIYAIEYDGTGAGFDAYVPYYGKFTEKLPGSVSFPTRSSLLKGDGEKTIITPASAGKVLCVGSYTTRSQWIDSENRIRSENLNTDSISVFSSHGPLLNGARKPEIAAPGEMIVAAFSSEAWARPRSIYRDGEHVSFRGTSMSAPHVSGAIALMYQQNPSLDVYEIRNKLINSAIDRGPYGWDRAWGYGKLDVLALLDIPSTPQGLEAIASDRSITVKWLPNEESDMAGYKIYILPGASLDAGNVTSYQLGNLPNGIPVSLSVSAYDTARNESPRTHEITITPNPPQTDVTPPDPPKGLSAMSVNTAIFVKWTRNSEHDLYGYRIYYGASSGNYDKVISVSNITSYMIENLTNGLRLYFAVTAYDVSGNESDKSEEVSAVPQLYTRSVLRYQGGWPVKMGHDVYSSPAIYDGNGDGRMEVAVSTRDGEVALLRYDGRYMPGWPISTGEPSVSSPALCDVDAFYPYAEIVACAGETIYMWHYDGTTVPGWPRKVGSNITASPALGDMDGDGRVEVVIGSLDGKVYALKGDGSYMIGWPVATRGPVYSSAAIGDVDGDSYNEVVVGSDDGNVYVFNGDGTIGDGWPIYLERKIHASPALGDIDGDGELEIVVADFKGRIYAWHYDGDPVAGWPVNLRDDITSSPALGDMDGDGKSLEIVICTKSGLIYMLGSDGVIMVGWPVSVMGDITASPALCDIDGNGSVEIIVGTSNGQHYVGLVYALSNTGKMSGITWPVYVEGNMINSSPAIGDLDGDGDIELVIGSCRLEDGSGGRLHAWDLPGRPAKERILWSMFCHDPCHTGIADDRIPPSFVITILQNAVLRKYLDIYIIASEPLSMMPGLTVKTDETINQIALNQIDAPSRIYQADYTITSSGSYTFTVSGTDMSGNVGYSSKTVLILLDQENPEVPARFTLFNNYPNPFNLETWIPYELPEPEYVTIQIYNAAGALIRTLNMGNQTAGRYVNKKNAAYWDGKGDHQQEIASGIYFYVLKAGRFRAVGKMSLLR